MSKTRKSNNKSLLPFPVIAAASGGDIDAINKVLKHYDVCNHFILDWHRQINLDCVRQSVSPSIFQMACEKKESATLGYRLLAFSC